MSKKARQKNQFIRLCLQYILCLKAFGLGVCCACLLKPIFSFFKTQYLSLFTKKWSGIIAYRILVSLWLISYSIDGKSQSTTYRDYDEVKLEESIIYTIDDGLPSNSVRNVLETPDGFLWISTSGGLSRFDGTAFKNFVHDPEDSTSLGDNRLTALFLDGEELWVGSHLGVSIMNRETETFRSYQFKDYQRLDTLDKKVHSRVGCIEQSGDGDIWLGTYNDGAFRYVAEKDTFLSYHYPQDLVAPHFPDKADIDRILSIEPDRFNDSIMWLGTLAGLVKVDIFSHEMEWYLYPKRDEKSFIPQNAMRNIYQHDDGLIYIGTWHAQVNVFDPEEAIFYPLPIKNPTAEEKEQAFKLINAPISPIIRKNANEIWIASIGGLMTYRTDTQAWTRIQKNDLRKKKIYCIRFIDSQQRAWFHLLGGLSVFDPTQQQFIQYEYDHLNPEFSGFTFYLIPTPQEELSILPRAADGIYTFNIQHNRWQKAEVPVKYRGVNGQFGPRGYSIAPNGHWTIPSLSGLYDYDPVTEVMQPLPMLEELKQKRFRSIAWDTAGRLWVGTDSEGLIRWTPQTNRWDVFYDELTVGSPQILAGNISLLYADQRGNVWIRRKEGYSVYDTQRDTFFNFIGKLNPEHALDFVHEFAEDHQGRMWLAGRNALLGVADLNSLEAGVIQKHDLLQSNQIPYLFFLRTAPDGKLWGIQGEFIHQVDPQTLAVTSYSLKYGVTEYDQIYGFDIMPDGRLVIGGKNKFWIGDPDNFISNQEIPKPYLINISVLQEPLASETPVHLIKDLSLEHDENFFSFDFSSIGFTRGEDNQFRFRLKNFDDKWSEPGPRRFANFTNVPSGEYLFELQVANNEGFWNKNTLSLPIQIAVPWWQTIWFWTLVVLAVLLVAYGIYKSRIRQVRKEERMRSEYERKLTDMEMSALRAQMNPHFIFNSLNSIEYFIISNEPEKASDYLNRFSRLIRLILQNSKNTIVPLKDDLEALKLYIEIESMRFDNIFDYEFKIQEDIDVEKTQVPPLLLQPYVENAIWHGLMQKKDGQGKIDLKIRRDNGALICLIEDNGIGRAAAEKLKSKSGTRKKSFGMKITSDRLDVLNQLAKTKARVQIFDLKSEEGAAKGTRVELVIPL